MVNVTVQMQEIEKKYLIKEDGRQNMTDALQALYPSLQALSDDVTENGVHIQQGYLPLEVSNEIIHQLGMEVDFEIAEARLRNSDGILTFTIKGDGGTSRNELEKEIDVQTFNTYWHHTKGKQIEKMRLKKYIGNRVLEIDFYLDRPLVVAEIEVDNKNDLTDLPEYGTDISEDKRYKNKNLAK